jgi:hypothetical protein
LFVAVVTLTEAPVQEVPDADTVPPAAAQIPAKGPTDLAGSG